jgi:ABC-type glycerol-3-phosphate transport system substrate-binding protein
MGLQASAATLQHWAYAHGATLYTVAGTSGLDSLAGRAALDRVRTYAQQGLSYGGADLTQLRDDFASERTLFHFEWSNELSELRAAIKTRSGFSWALAPLPAVSNTSVAAPPARIPMQTQLWLTPKTAPQTESEGRRFVRWMLSAPQAAAWSARTEELPARRAAIAEFGRLKPAATELAETWRVYAPLAAPEPLLMGTLCANEQTVQVFAGVEDGSRSLDEAILGLRTAAQSNLRRDCVLIR